MTGFYMECNKGQKWFNVLNSVLKNVFKVNNKDIRMTLVDVTDTRMIFH